MDRHSDQDRDGLRDRVVLRREDIRGRDARDSHTDRQQGRARAGAAPKRPVVNPNSKQAELLAFAASDLNAFSNDGSFMEKFAASQGAKAGAAMQGNTGNNEELDLSGKCCDSLNLRQSHSHSLRLRHSHNLPHTHSHDLGYSCSHTHTRSPVTATV